MFYERRYGHTDDPWFRIGTFGVSTTVFVLALGVISMIMWAVEGAYGPLFRHLILVSDDLTLRGDPLGSVLEGELWRLLTWPIPNEPDFWTIVLFAIFYMLGSQLERLLGRWRFAFFLLVLTILPAACVTVLEALFGFEGVAAGLRMVEVGVLVAFAANYAQARFWPGIPGWVIAVVVVGLDAIQAIGSRDEYSLILLTCTVALALFGIRAFGHAADLTWIPKLSFGPRVGGPQAKGSFRRSTTRQTNQTRGSRLGRSQQSREHLRAVPVDETKVTPEIDELLDQVASKGLGSLSARQRKRLEAHSKRLRRQH